MVIHVDPHSNLTMDEIPRNIKVEIENRPITTNLNNLFHIPERFSTTRTTGLWVQDQTQRITVLGPDYDLRT